jgi:hypothetical protein
MKTFTVHNRTPGHWDICAEGHGRLFRVRGGPGAYWVSDERQDRPRRDSVPFKTVGACMSYICDELMFELIVAEGQEPIMIESWNI